MIQSKKVSVIIPSAGIGKRMGAMPGGIGKQFLTLQGRPLLCHTIEKFERSKYVDDIVVVCATDTIPFVKKEIVESFGFSKVKSVVEGGKERQDSVYAGFKSLVAADIVLVHDAVRPFVKTETIDLLIEACDAAGASILAVRLKDTVKLQDNEGFVKETIDRSVLWNVQTPQAFDYKILKHAFAKAFSEGFYGTDESMLVERIGKKVKIVEGDYTNIKITTPDDLIWVERYAIMDS
jgi:2-C-methyl-D-erythritol 4-phosphate cytidylyltransferase